MDFEPELGRAIPFDLPHRETVIRVAARHLERIAEANLQFNLTRITGAREAAIKHVLDAVWPWRWFSGAATVLDAGTGAGFPGIPLAVALPGTRFTLSESVGKKARFVEETVTALGLENVEVVNGRAEEILRGRRFDVVTARAVAPLEKMCGWFGPAVRGGCIALLYKGPDAEAEIAAAAGEAQRQRIKMRAVERYELLDEMGTRTLVELRARGT